MKVSLYKFIGAIKNNRSKSTIKNPPSFGSDIRDEKMLLKPANHCKNQKDERTEKQECLAVYG
jgi:hypothetical protein